MPANSSNRGLTLRKKTSFKKRLYKKVPRPVPNIHSVVPQRLGGIYNIAVNTSTGWNGVDNSIQFTFTLDGVYAKIGTGSNNLVLAWVNTTYLCALYSLYRLKSLKCTVISVAANAFPKPFSDMIRFAMAGDFSMAKRINDLLVEGYSYMYEENNPSGIKAYMFEQGLIENELRLPLVPVSAPLQAKIHNYLQRYISQ